MKIYQNYKFVFESCYTHRCLITKSEKREKNGEAVGQICASLNYLSKAFDFI